MGTRYPTAPFADRCPYDIRTGNAQFLGPYSCLLPLTQVHAEPLALEPIRAHAGRSLGREGACRPAPRLRKGVGAPDPGDRAPVMGAEYAEAFLC